MSKITLFEDFYPLIVFDSHDFKVNDRQFDSNAIVAEIVKCVKKHEDEYQYFLIQNKSFCFGTETFLPPMLMLDTTLFGGLEGTLEVHIDGIVYDLLPGPEEEAEKE